MNKKLFYMLEMLLKEHTLLQSLWLDYSFQKATGFELRVCVYMDIFAGPVEGQKKKK